MQSHNVKTENNNYDTIIGRGQSLSAPQNQRGHSPVSSQPRDYQQQPPVPSPDQPPSLPPKTMTLQNGHQRRQSLTSSSLLAGMESSAIIDAFLHGENQVSSTTTTTKDPSQQQQQQQQHFSATTSPQDDVDAAAAASSASAADKPALRGLKSLKKRGLHFLQA